MLCCGGSRRRSRAEGAGTPDGSTPRTRSPGRGVGEGGEAVRRGRPGTPTMPCKSSFSVNSFSALPADRREDVQAEAGESGDRASPTGPTAAQAAVLAEELRKEGNALYNRGSWEAAELVYSEALKHAPRSHVLLSNRSMCLGRLGRFEDALVEAKRVVATMPTWGRGAARLGAAHEALGQYSEAVSAYEKARWLATSHDNDPQGLKEYDAALAQARWRASSGFMDDLALAQGQGPKGALGRGERFPSKGPDAAPPP